MDKEEKISSLESQLSSLNEEMNNLKMILSVSENTKQETIDELKQVHNQEIESLRCVLQDSMEEQRNELFHEFERERQRWEDEKNSYVKQIDNHKKEKEVLNVPPVVKGDDEMDDRMKQAQFEAEKLRTVVLPLEEEILQLKKKLEEYASKEKEAESNNSNIGNHEENSIPTVDQGPSTSDQETQSDPTTETAVCQNGSPIPTNQSTNENLSVNHRVNSAPQLGSDVGTQSSSNEDTSSNQVHESEITFWKVKFEEEQKKVASYNDLKSQSDDLLSTLNDKLELLEKRFQEERDWRLKKEAADNDEIGKLIKNRNHIKEAYISLKREHDSLRKLVEKHKMEVDYTMTVPAAATPEMFQTISRYKNALIAANTERSQKETKLMSKINFLEQSLRAEQVAKEQMENTLSLELEETRVQLASFHSLQSQLDKETKERSDLETALEEEKLTVHSIRTKSRTIINNYKEKLIAEKELITGLEKSLDEEKHKSRSLQSALETSEQVQRDFVQLSQSLQMQLEELRNKYEKEEEGTLSSSQSEEANLTPAPS